MKFYLLLNYKIVIKNYIPENEDEAAYDEGVLQLTRDILSGNAPDLIDLSNIDYQRYSGSGMFEDLYPYIHQDKEFKNRNLNQNILKLLLDNYNLSEEGALEINALKDDYEYSLQLEALVNGEVYQSQSEIEQQEEEEAEKYSDLEDILPEEEEYLNGIGD